jgi:hypothetical protein
VFGKARKSVEPVYKPAERFELCAGRLAVLEKLVGGAVFTQKIVQDENHF